MRSVGYVFRSVFDEVYHRRVVHELHRCVCGKVIRLFRGGVRTQNLIVEELGER